MFLVVEKMGAAAEDDELLLVFWRLAGGAMGEPPVLFEEDIFQKRGEQNFASGLKAVTGSPEMAFYKKMEEKNKIDVWRNVAGFHGKSTPHHSNTPQYHA